MTTSLQPIAAHQSFHIHDPEPRIVHVTVCEFYCGQQLVPIVDVLDGQAIQQLFLVASLPTVSPVFMILLYLMFPVNSTLSLNYLLLSSLVPNDTWHRLFVPALCFTTLNKTVSCRNHRSGSRAGGRSPGLPVPRWILSADARHAVREREAQNQVGFPVAQSADVASRTERYGWEGHSDRIAL